MFSSKGKYFTVSTMVALGLAVGACQDKAVDPVLSQPNDQSVGARVSYNTSEGNALLEDVARVVAKSLDEKGFRQLIKEEAEKKFDGDYDILFRDFVKKSAKDGKKVKEKLDGAAGALSKQQQKEEKYLSKQLAKAEQAFPKLNIAVPVNIEKWNPDTYNPLVAVRGLDYNEGVTTKLKAFDQQGNVHWIDAVNLPTNPVVVIGMNERVKIDAQGNVSFKDTQVRLEPGEKLSGARAAAALDGCRYQSNAYLYLKAMKFTGNWGGEYEGWPAGAPEVDVRVFAPTTASNFNVLGEIRFMDNLEPGRRADINDRWWELSQTVTYWNPSIYTETLLFDFTEDDDQVAVNFKKVNIGGTFKIFGQSITLGVEFEIKTMDEHIGKMTVDRCAAPPQNNDGEYYDVNDKFRFRLSN